MPQWAIRHDKGRCRARYALPDGVRPVHAIDDHAAIHLLVAVGEQIEPYALLLGCSSKEFLVRIERG